MTTRITKPAINIREALAELAGLKPPKITSTVRHEFDGSTNKVKLDPGHRPFAVYLDGLRQDEGELNDYTITFDGFRYRVVWAVAPSNVSVALIDVEIVQ